MYFFRPTLHMARETTCQVHVVDWAEMKRVDSCRDDSGIHGRAAETAFC